MFIRRLWRSVVNYPGPRQIPSWRKTQAGSNTIVEFRPCNKLRARTSSWGRQSCAQVQINHSIVPFSNSRRQTQLRYGKRLGWQGSMCTQGESTTTYKL